MKVLVGLLLLVALGCAGSNPPAWELPPPPPREGPVAQPEDLHRTRLANGLEVLVLEDRRLPRVGLGLVVPRGSAWLPAEQAGHVAFMAELLNRGAGDRDALAFARAVDFLGASVSASSDWDSVSLHASGLSRDFTALTSLLADMALRPRFDSDEAARLRSQRLAGLERAKDDPATLARWQLARELFSGHPYGLPEIGTPETVAALDAAAARKAHTALVVPEGSILYATGDVSADEVVARARELFGAWSGTASAARGGALPAPPTTRRVAIVDRPELGQATILLGGQGIPRTAPDRIATQLLNTVLGSGGFSSRIMSRVREDEGLAYYAYSIFRMRRDGGLFAAATGTRVEEAGRAVDMLLEEAARGRSEPPTADELAHARSLAVGRFGLGLETSDAIVAGLVDLEVHGLPRDSLDTYRTRVREVTDAEVRAAAEAHLHPERLVIVVVGPAEKLRPQLERLGPTEVLQP